MNAAHVRDLRPAGRQSLVIQEPIVLEREREIPAAEMTDGVHAHGPARAGKLLAIGRGLMPVTCVCRQRSDVSWRPDEVAQWSLTTLREKLVKVGARLVRHGRYAIFQLAELAVPRSLFAEILRRIDRLRGSPMPET
jgi:hypothetical protein